jgi:hypothetical protein
MLCRVRSEVVHSQGGFSRNPLPDQFTLVARVGAGVVLGWVGTLASPCVLAGLCGRDACIALCASLAISEKLTGRLVR